MPAFPATPAEALRIFPYRHYWKYQPLTRSVVFSFMLLYSLYLMTPLAKSVAQKKIEQGVHGIHHGEASYTYARAQRREDAKYFKEYDPKAKLRPKWFKDEISWTKLNYYPHGYSVDH
jgi:hypothetical protein